MNIYFKHARLSESMLVSYDFIDRYLGRCPSRYIEVYLVLLRYADIDISISQIASILAISESAVLEAVRFFVSVGQICCDELGEQTSDTPQTEDAHLASEASEMVLEDEIVLEDELATEDETVLEDELVTEDELVEDDEFETVEELATDDELATEDELVTEDEIAIEEELAIEDESVEAEEFETVDESVDELLPADGLAINEESKESTLSDEVLGIHADTRVPAQISLDTLPELDIEPIDIPAQISLETLPELDIEPMVATKESAKQEIAERIDVALEPEPVEQIDEPLDTGLIDDDEDIDLHDVPDVHETDDIEDIDDIEEIHITGEARTADELFSRILETDDGELSFDTPAGQQAPSDVDEDFIETASEYDKMDDAATRDISTRGADDLLDSHTQATMEPSIRTRIEEPIDVSIDASIDEVSMDDAFMGEASMDGASINLPIEAVDTASGVSIEPDEDFADVGEQDSLQENTRIRLDLSDTLDGFLQTPPQATPQKATKAAQQVAPKATPQPVAQKAEAQTAPQPVAQKAVAPQATTRGVQKVEPVTRAEATPQPTPRTQTEPQPPTKAAQQVAPKATPQPAPKAVSQPAPQPAVTRGVIVQEKIEPPTVATESYVEDFSQPIPHTNIPYTGTFDSDIGSKFDISELDVIEEDFSTKPRTQSIDYGRQESLGTIVNRAVKGALGSARSEAPAQRESFSISEVGGHDTVDAPVATTTITDAAIADTTIADSITTDAVATDATIADTNTEESAHSDSGFERIRLTSEDLDASPYDLEEVTRQAGTLTSQDSIAMATKAAAVALSATDSVRRRAASKETQATKEESVAPPPSMSANMPASLVPSSMKEPSAATKTVEEPERQPQQVSLIAPDTYEEADISHDDRVIDMDGLRADSKFGDLLYVMQRYLGRIFTALDTETIGYLYGNLGMGADLLEYLTEVCAEKGKTSLRYLETVALDWHKRGIKTVEEAKKGNARYTSEVYGIMKTFGLSRDPGTVELEFITKWYKEYGFTQDLIQEACSRALTATGKPSFKYADAILDKWKTSGVKQLSDVKRSDIVYKQQKQATEAKATTRPARSGNFTAFEQRDDDLDALIIQRWQDKNTEDDTN